MSQLHDTKVPMSSTVVLTTEDEIEEDEKLIGKVTARFPEVSNTSFTHRVSPNLSTSIMTTSDPTNPRSWKYRATWRRALFKIKAQKAINKVNEDILVYGTNNELTDMNMQYKINIDELIETKSRKSERFRKLTTDQYYSETNKTNLISPNSKFKKIWNALLAFILLYTAIIMPFRIAFYDVVFWDAWTILDLAIDGMFMCDVVVNFFSVQVNADGTLELSHSKIVKSYLRSWFLLDFTASLPFSLLDMFQTDTNGPSSNKYNSLLRLARLPRLYKLFRVARILKAFRHYRSTGLVERIQDFLQINSRLYKLLKFLISVFICVHVVGCFWFYSSRVDGFGPQTWVVRTNHQDDDFWTLYLFSIYWAITTCVTVGYGDITARTELEMVLCMIWMIAGVGFYSFTVGSLSSFLTSIDTRESILSSKMAAIQEFAKEAGISNECKLKIRSAIKYNTFKTGSVWQDKHSLFNELPKNLRYEVALSMYNGVASHFPLFIGKDPAFIIFVLPLFRPLRLTDTEYVFKEGDHADEVYLITQGRVNLVMKYSEIVYKSFLRGSLIGDVEVLRQTRRLCNAQCHGVCEFLVLTSKDLNELMREFPSEGRRLMAVAKEKARRVKQAFFETLELLKMKRVNGSIKELAGQDRILEVGEEDEADDTEIEAADKFIKK